MLQRNNPPLMDALTSVSPDDQPACDHARTTKVPLRLRECAGAAPRAGTTT